MSLRIFVLTGFVVLCSHLSSLTYAQDNSPARGIPSDDFANSRQQSTPSNAGKSGATKTQPATTKANRRNNSAVARRKETYKLVERVEPQVNRRRSKNTPQVKPNPKETATIEEVGVTMWRLRPPRNTDTGPKLPVKVDDSVQMWTPERISVNTQFQSGDRVRLAIESKRPGYLYVINSEMYRDGRVGKPVLLFPFPIQQDNQVEAGVLVDIPGQSDVPPYFYIDPKAPGYVGELLLVIISPRPLDGLQLGEGKDQEIINVDLLAQWEEQWGTDVNLYMKDGGEGEALTDSEQQAACGASTRQLVRENPGTQNAGSTPCGAKTRRLTREEPLPQNIYRVSVPKDQPVIIPVRISVTR